MNWMKAIEGLQLPPLSGGAHDSPEVGLCAMEMVAFMERLPHSDSPECTCPVVAAFVREANDRLPHTERQKLLAVLPELVGTVAPEYEQQRAEYFAWLAIREWAPAALRRAGIDESLIVAMERADSLESAAGAASACAAAARAAAHVSAFRVSAFRARAAANAAAVSSRRCVLPPDTTGRPAYVAAHAARAAAAIASADLYISAIRGALAIGPKAKGFTNLDALPELVSMA